jgi:hypothetical protein
LTNENSYRKFLGLKVYTFIFATFLQWQTKSSRVDSQIAGERHGFSMEQKSLGLNLGLATNPVVFTASEEGVTSVVVVVAVEEALSSIATNDKIGQNKAKRIRLANFESILFFAKTFKIKLNQNPRIEQNSNLFIREFKRRYTI